MHLRCCVMCDIDCLGETGRQEGARSPGEGAEGDEEQVLCWVVCFSRAPRGSMRVETVCLTCICVSTPPLRVDMVWSLPPMVSDLCLRCVSTWSAWLAYACQAARRLWMCVYIYMIITMTNRNNEEPDTPPTPKLNLSFWISDLSSRFCCISLGFWV